MAKQSFPNIKKVHQSVFPNVVFGSSENMSMKSDLFTFGSLRWPPIILCVYQSSVACFEGDSQRRQFVGKIKKYFWKNLNLPPRLLKKYVERRWQGAWGNKNPEYISNHNALIYKSENCDHSNWQSFDLDFEVCMSKARLGESYICLSICGIVEIRFFSRGQTSKMILVGTVWERCWRKNSHPHPLSSVHPTKCLS